MRRSRKPLSVVRRIEGSNPSPSAHSLVVRAAALAVAAVVAVLIAAPAADAHVRTSRSAVDFRVRVFPLREAARGVLTARVYESDLALALTVADRSAVVLVLGYLGEPAIRVDHAGVAVNEGSPTAAGMGLLKGAPRAAGAPVWQRRSSGRSIVWHDNRVRGLPAGVDRGRWSVPLIVNGRRTQLAGAIRRVHAPAAWPWFVLGLPFVGAVALLFLLARQHVRTAAVAFGPLASVGLLVSAAGFALDTYSSEGKWVEAANELIFVLVGVLLVLRGSPDTRAIAGGALGLLALAVGLSKIPVLLHGIVLSALSAEVARTVVVLTICCGGAATAAGLGVFANLLEMGPESL